MYLLETVTQGYDKIEDRLFMRAKIHNEEAVVRLWLTSRLLNLMVPYLVKRVAPTEHQKQASAQLPAKTPSTSSNSPTAQTNATPATESDENLKAVEHTEHYWIDEVVQTLDIQTKQQKVHLIFVLNEQKLALVLNPDQLKKWLTSLYRLSQQPHWSLNVWPAWMAENERQNQRAPLH